MSKDFFTLRNQLKRSRARVCMLEISLGKSDDVIMDLRSKVATLEIENSNLRSRLENSCPAKVEP